MGDMRRWLLILGAGTVLLATGGCSSVRPPQDVVPVERVLVTTAYCKCGECCGWRRTWYGRPVYKSGPLKGETKRVGLTASGRMARYGTIAADTSRYPFGTIMHVPGYGYGRVEDRGGAVKGERIDLFFHSHSQAKRWGKKPLRVHVWFPPGHRR